ncbi:Alb1-domain-containing protein [Nemania sp. FL0916]|nr:Alb1-domain-containing protein [Nemania sp. FL0916]
MARGVITKKKKAPSLHSRAARRATSPGIDTDKSLKEIRPPPESVDHRPSILAIHHGAGVSRKQRKNRAISSKARRRHEKAQDRAATIMDRTEKKVALSKGQSRAIQTRRKIWEEINQSIPSNNSKAELKTQVDRDENMDEFDPESEIGDAEGYESHQGNTDKAAIRSAIKIATSQDDNDDGIS